ncbi:hypothetical protein KGF57_003641 [Candida theae]|uniref:Uncharacterized protein n=1 Tax=Candida theae TaxID=1198502 RepID=A0AAD5BD53_9ASCO|nr:uncharacterized protein KGF57_003641 [Candida theae]KAI5955509.1 hypothetical protein KGF57_003641 [Candida theae]
MINIHLQATQEWLTCWVLDVNYEDPKPLQEELVQILDSIDNNQFTILLLKQHDWYLYNLIQMMILKTGKSIVVNYVAATADSPEKYLQMLHTLVKQIDDSAMDLKIGFALSREQLAFLILNVPGFINHLTRGGSIEEASDDIDVAFQEFVQKYPSIKLIISSHKFPIE